MYGYIYLTVDLLKGRVYVGQHKSKEYDKNYLGSGKIIKNIIKSRKDTLKNYVIEWCETKEELDEAEKSWIKNFREECGKRCLNIIEGGTGGDTLSNHPNKDIIFKKRKTTKGRICIFKENNEKVICREVLDDYIKNGWDIGRSPAHREKNSSSHKGQPAWNKGKPGKVGENNPNFGKMRVNNGEVEKMIRPEELQFYLDNGYVLGRKIKTE